MISFLFRKGRVPRKVVSTGIMIFALIFVFSQPLSYGAFALHRPAGSVLGEETVEVSAEAQAAGESELVVSAEAQKELAIDLHAELGHEGYDPIVPTDGVLGTIVHPLKNIAWDIQEGVYNVFTSDETHAQLVNDHAEKELIAAVKVYSADPSRAGTAVGILEEYHDDLADVKDIIPKLKEDNPEFAKQLAGEIAEKHMFIAPKVLGSMQDGILNVAPEQVPKLVEIKGGVLAAAGQSIFGAAETPAEATETLNIIANKKQQTAFSGISNAEILSQVKDSLGDAVSNETHKAFDQVIGVQLKTVEENIKNLAASDEVKAGQFKNYVAQLPGSNLTRMKMVDTFKSTTGLPPIFIEKCNEIKAKVAESISKKIEAAVNQIVNEEVRKAFNEAMLHVATPGVDDLRILNEFHDLVPSEQIRQDIAKNRDSQVEKFLGRFGTDANAAKVTNEFKTLTDKVASGQILPDPKFFQTLEGLKNRLSPEQQKFITDMENTGKQEMVNRMQKDTHFAERFSSFNPADMQVFEKFSKEGFGPQFGPPPGFDFGAKFAQIEAKQAQNFEKFLGFQNNPESVKQIQQHFDNFVPQEIRQRFETRYDFNQESFSKHETFASQKHEFFQQKFTEIQKQYQEKFGSQGRPGGFPGQVPSPFPGGPGFGFPGIGAPGGGFGGFTPPPFFQGGHTDDGSVFPRPEVIDIGVVCPAGTTKTAYGCEIPYERPQYDPSASCASSGGSWTGSYCKFSQEYQTPAYQTPTGNYPSPYGEAGKYLTPPAYQTPPPGYPTPTETYPTPTESYPTPSETYPTPTETYPSPTGTYQTPSYPTPSETYPTPTKTYPTPTETYPTPTESYPTPTTSTYPTPTTETYPTPAYAYPTPEYPTPAYATPAYAYPTPTEYPTPYATPAAYKGPGQVAGAWTEVPERDLGTFDFLAFFGLAWYGYRRRRKKLQGMA